MLKYLIALKLFVFASGNTVCSSNQFYCDTLQTCLYQELTCPERCDLCLIRQSNGENINCRNDCDFNTLHYNECSDNPCENQSNTVFYT